MHAETFSQRRLHMLFYNLSVAINTNMYDCSNALQSTPPKRYTIVYLISPLVIKNLGGF